MISALEDSEVREKRHLLVLRTRLLMGGALLLLGIVASAFWVVQIVGGEEYLAMAENNRLRKRSVEAVRGLIYDRNNKLLVANIPSYELQLNRVRVRDPQLSLEYAADILGRSTEELQRSLQRHQGSPPFRPVRLVSDIEFAHVAHFAVTAFEHPEFEVTVGSQRSYREGSGTAHVLGYLGEVTERELRDGGWKVGDLVGRRGLERHYDQALRGRSGQRIVVVDSRGRAVEQHAVEAALPGNDLVTTLDLDLQRAAEAQLEGKVGAVVALEPATGAILAMVSSPSYDPNLFIRRLAPEEWQRLLDHPHDPLQNRAIQTTNAPGSVFKIVVALAGLEAGLIDAQHRVFCNGAVTLYDHRFRCWTRGGHGWTNLEEALERSCDVYFYHLGQRLGIQAIADKAREFGYGRSTGIDLDGENPGLVPDPRWALEKRGSRWFAGETISVAIGQGPLLATPLQVAVMMSAVANGGTLVQPHLVAPDSLPPQRRVQLPPDHLELIRRSLRRVVQGRNGTGHLAALPGIEVAGKTSTVQVINQKTWTESDSLPFELRDHAWFAAYAPAQNPELVVVAFVEHGGAGSRAAAPIARALYEVYFRARLRAEHTP